MLVSLLSLSVVGLLLEAVLAQDPLCPSLLSAEEEAGADLDLSAFYVATDANYFLGGIVVAPVAVLSF